MNLENTELLFYWRPLEGYSQADLQSQDRKCTCNLTLRLVRATVVAVEDQEILHILSVCW
jgi:hypothetical protein